MWAQGPASDGANVSLCVLELQDGIVKARGRDGTSGATAPLLALGHPALHSADKSDRRRLEALKHLGAAGARVRLAGRWVESAQACRRRLWGTYCGMRHVAVNCFS